MNKQEWLDEYHGLDAERDTVAKMFEDANNGEARFEDADTAGFDLNEKYRDLAHAAAAIFEETSVDIGAQLNERLDALGDATKALKTEQTWTFVGHWDNDRIVVEYVLPGEVVDVRDDTGFWEQGLWAASGSGTSMEQAQADVIAEYEAEYNDEAVD